MKSKFLAIMLLGLVATAFLVACGGDDSTPATPTATQPAAAQGGSAAAPESTPGLAPGQISAEPITLRIFAPRDANVLPYEQLDTIIAHSARTNINVVWEQPTFQEQDERLNILIASGEFPDMFWNIRNQNYLNLRAGGVARDISEFITPETTPNLLARMAENPGVAASITEADGSIFQLPFIDANASNDPLIIRQDWLDALGLPMPVTLDDWFEYWVGVRDNDLNGNGDEIPLSVVNSGARVNYFRTWVSAFEMNDRFFVDQQNGGQIIFSNIDPRYLEFLEWANMLWNEDILDREFASMNTDGHQTKVAQNRIGSYRGKLGGQLSTPMNNLPSEIPGFSLIGTEPIRSANGLQLHPGVQELARFDVVGGIVSATSQHPREAVMFMDWFYDITAPTGGAFQMMFGEENITLEFRDGEPFFTDYVMNNPDGLTPGQVRGRYMTMGQHSGYVPTTGVMRMWHPQAVDSLLRIEPFYNESVQWMMPNLMLTDEEHAIIRRIMADVDTYVDEQVNNFIMGRRPLSEFDAYVATVERMGIGEVLEIYNNALARR